MATNLGANLDEAFARRIHFIIDFPFPDEDTRLRLWQLLLPENIEKEAEIDLRPFAAAYKIAGGGIRNAVVWAIYESARLGRPHRLRRRPGAGERAEKSHLRRLPQRLDQRGQKLPVGREHLLQDEKELSAPLRQQAEVKTAPCRRSDDGEEQQSRPQEAFHATSSP